MYTSINNELRKLKQDIIQCKHIDKMLNNLREQLLEQERKQFGLEFDFKKIKLKIEKVEKISLYNFIHNILTNKEERILKKQQEIMSLRLRLEDINKQIEETKRQVSDLQLERSKVSRSEREYEKLYKQKHKTLKENDSINAEIIIKLEEKINNYENNLKEINEAIMAGNSTLSSIDKVEKSLGSAKNWGTWDLLGGDGIITHMSKHGHINDAREAASEVQTKLNRFTTELIDVQITSSIKIDIQGFTKFADFFFDGFISDWIVQSKINDAQASVTRVRREVSHVLSILSSMQMNDKKQLMDLENDLAQTILNS